MQLARPRLHLRCRASTPAVLVLPQLIRSHDCNIGTNLARLSHCGIVAAHPHDGEARVRAGVRGRVSGDIRNRPTGLSQTQDSDCH